jgi:NADPH:quinone reductase-like Zn-dependent oxidoreductase
LGLNRAEVMYRTNTYTEQAQFPSRIGYEAAGVIDAVGEGVTEFQIMVNDAGGISIAITRKVDKREGLLKAGAQHVIVTDREDMAERVSTITNGKGADIVFDPVSGSYLEKLADIVAPEGLILEYGWLAAGTPVFPVVPAIVKGFRVQGFHLSFHVIVHPERLQAGISYINQRLQSGAFHPLIAANRFKLDRIVDAYQYMESNEQLGKIVVTV